jgi:hypothetical protein
LYRSKTCSKHERSRLQARRPRFPRKLLRSLDAWLRKVHLLLLRMEQGEPLREKSLDDRARCAPRDCARLRTTSHPDGGRPYRRDGLFRTGV